MVYYDQYIDDGLAHNYFIGTFPSNRTNRGVFKFKKSEVMENLFRYICLFFCLIAGSHLSAFQDEDAAVRLSATLFSTNGSTEIRVKARTRVGRRYENVPGLKLELKAISENIVKSYGSQTSNTEGEIVWNVNDDLINLSDSLGYTNFSVVLEGQTGYEDNVEELSVRKAILNLEFQPEDSTAHLEAVLFDAYDSIPIEDGELRFYIKRYFAPYYLTESDFTDSEGLLSTELLSRYPGDRNGMIVVGVILDDSDDYGTIRTEKTIDWGIPFVDQSTFDQRTLWSPRSKTPLWLLIWPNIIIIGVWGTLAMLIRKLYIISKS